MYDDALHRAHLAAARSTDVAARRLGLEADALSLAWSGMPRTGLVQRQLLGDGREEVANVLGRLGRRLEEEEAGFACVGLGICCGNGALIRLLGDQIQLVAGKGDDDVFVRLSLQLLDPRLRLIQRRLGRS